LPEALAQLGERWAASTAGSVQTVITGDPYPLPAQIEATLLRAAQEALHNVRKHAGAREATLTLSYMPDTAILDVYDNGRGFDPAALEEPLRTEATEATHGYGLQAMRERVAEVGGTVSIESAPGAGTTISVAIPTTCAPAQPYPERSP
jgi:signal transduction histidine kinase